MAGSLLPTDSSGKLLTTAVAAGATYRNGFLTSPAGEAVVTTDPTGCAYRAGFVRAPNGALLIL